MTLIISVIIAIYVLLIAWTWHNLGQIEKTKKILVILIGIVIIYLITLFIFNLSKNGINYEQEIIEQNIRRVLVTMFTGVNSLIILPYTAKLLEKLQENEMDQKEISKKLCIMAVIFIICMFFECGYMKDIQQGILEMANVYLGTETNQK